MSEPKTVPPPPPPPTAREIAEKCFSPWDGNWEQLEDYIRPMLFSEKSMETIEIRFNADDDTSDGSILVVMSYYADNLFGVSPTQEAAAEMNLDCSVGTVWYTGLE